MLVEGRNAPALGKNILLQRNDLVGLHGHETVVLFEFVLEEVADVIDGPDAVDHHGLQLV